MASPQLVDVTAYKPVTLCHLSDLVDGEARGFDPLGNGHDSIFVVRQGACLYGYRNVCPHQGSTLPWRRHAYLNAARSRIVCCAHGAEFDIESGRCIKGPAMGQSLEKVALTVTDDRVDVARIRIGSSRRSG